jgi:hypothetical protein
MASKAVIPFLVTMMLVTGVCNTILNKYQVRAEGDDFQLSGRNSCNEIQGHAMCQKL